LQQSIPETSTQRGEYSSAMSSSGVGYRSGSTFVGMVAGCTGPGSGL